jgi:hypothetical protein
MLKTEAAALLDNTGTSATVGTVLLDISLIVTSLLTSLASVVVLVRAAVVVV